MPSRERSGCLTRATPPATRGWLCRTWRDAERILAKTAEAGLDLEVITAALERDGVRSFCSSYHELLDCIGSKLPALAGSQRARRATRSGPQAPSSRSALLPEPRLPRAARQAPELAVHWAFLDGPLRE